MYKDIGAANYRPTEEERVNLRPRPDMLKVSGDGVFATLQGEGVTAGKPSVFLRLHFCNLTCGVPTGWECDTGYTWDRTTREFWQEPQDWSFGQTALNIQEAWDNQFGKKQDRRLVVTGGEPLIQQAKIAKLLTELPGWEVEIETNGTIMPISELYDCQFNCSPKLANSGNSARSRYKPEVLKAINLLPRSQFKFVVSAVSDLAEIETIAGECKLDPRKILIMPEGQTAEEVQEHAQIIKDAVDPLGWGLTLRNQLIWYGAKRRT